MRYRKPVFVVTSIGITGLLGLISVRVHAQTSQPVSQSAPSSLERPYDWKASFAKYPTGKVPRMRDGKPDLQGLWSFSILTPLERPGSQHAEQISQEDAESAEENAQARQKNLRIEPTATPLEKKQPTPTTPSGEMVIFLKCRLRVYELPRWSIHQMSAYLH